MQLPLRLNWDRAQDRWATLLNPVISNEINQGTLLTDINLKSGSNVINHKLGRQPLGWIIVDQTASAEIYRTAWSNLTLTLNSSATASVALWVF